MSPAFVDVEVLVGDGVGPAPDEAGLDGALLPGIAEGEWVVAEPADADDRGCVSVTDRGDRLVAQPVFVDPERVPVALKRRAGAAVQVLPGAAHAPWKGRAVVANAERANLAVDLLDHVLDARLLIERRDRLGAAPTVDAINAAPRRPVGVAGASLVVGPEEHHGERDRAAADLAAAPLVLVVGRLGGLPACRPVVGPGHRCARPRRACAPFTGVAGG